MVNKNVINQVYYGYLGVYDEWVEWYKTREYFDRPDSTIEYMYNELLFYGFTLDECDTIIYELLNKAFLESKGKGAASSE